MKRSLRYLRIAYSATCLIACVLLIALWVRSYSNRSRSPATLFESGRFALYSTNGVLVAVDAMWFESNRTSDVNVSYFIPSRYQAVDGGFGWVRARKGLCGFSAHVSSRYSSWLVQLPYWFLVALAGIVAVAPWIRQLSWRFTLRTLLIATTLVAVVLGLIVYASR